MNTYTKKQKGEALKRLNHIKTPEIITKNLKDDIVMVSTKNGLENLSEKHRKVISQIEEDFGHYIYHVIDMDGFVNYLFVSKYESDWFIESTMLDQNIAYAYVYNEEHNKDSEIGAIGIEIHENAIYRTD